MDVARWRGVGRVLVADVLPAAAAGAVMVLGSGPAASGEVPPRRPLDPLAWALMAVAASVLLGRRRWPLGALAVTVAASVVYLALEYPYGPILLAMSVAMYSVAARRTDDRLLAATQESYAVLARLHEERVERVVEGSSPRMRSIPGMLRLAKADQPPIAEAGRRCCEAWIGWLDQQAATRPS